MGGRLLPSGTGSTTRPGIFYLRGEKMMLRRLAISSLVLASLISLSETRAAVLLSFGGYTWDQANVPNTGIQLGVNDTITRSGATFGPANDANQPRTGNITGFVEGQAGINTGVGYLSRITQRKTS